MSFENGYEATAYIEKCIERYKQDGLVFYKALQIISTFSKHPSWPHNFSELDNAVKNILGNRLEGILRFTGQYLYASSVPQMRQVEWPDDLPVGLKEDLVAFYYSISPLIEQARVARANPLRFYGVAMSQIPASETTILKFMRMDGASLELEMTKHDVRSLINTLERIIQDSSELK
ncbi:MULTISPECIES: hypothetical protein [Sporomusa]|jgi:hypothetical protein|uniref:hypothetical protein n=1 Tax=Sporomusa TaxID=2375 RepID=UPI002BB3699B|nr:hypothetical protein [Sporomusa sphaeroides]HML33921.1 hypothetical protein [Sporomusa sphaeroides]